MASEPIWWSNLNHVSDEMLRNIVKYGKIEETVSKERISTRFRVAVDGALSKIRSFPLHSYNRRYATLAKRMPSLEDCRFLENVQDPEYLSQLAAINQCLGRCLDTYQSPLLLGPLARYIEAVKKINPDYDASNVEYIFKPGWWTGMGWVWDLLPDPLSLLEKHPDMKLKLELNCSDMGHGTWTSGYSHLCHKIRLESTDSENFDRGQLYPSVEHVVLDENYPYVGDLELFPNLKRLEIECSKTGMTITTILPYLSTKIRALKVSNSTNYYRTPVPNSQPKPWEADDLAALTTIMNTIPLVKFELDSGGEYPERQVVEMIVDSPCELKSLHMRSLDIEDGCINDKWNLEWPELFNDRELLLRLLLKFKQVKKISVPRDIDQMTKDLIKDVCRQVELADHRRSIRACIEYYHPYVTIYP